MSEQRSELRCVSSGGTNEGILSEGSGDVAGTYIYNRTGLTIANGVSAGGNINFELHAGRTYGGSACNTTYNKVDNNTWTVTVYYSPLIPPVADFIADNTMPENDVTTVNFTNLTTGSTPITYLWSFSPSSITYMGGTSPEPSERIPSFVPPEDTHLSSERCSDIHA